MSTELIIGGIVVIGIALYFILKKKKKKNGNPYNSGRGINNTF